jgi:hypothetical protein
MSRPTPPAYRTKNWPAYNEALKRRGSLTIWFDPAMIWEAEPTGNRGRHPDYSDAAIQTCLTMKVLFGILNLLDDLKGQLGLSMLFVTHNLKVVAHRCGRRNLNRWDRWMFRATAA